MLKTLFLGSAALGLAAASVLKPIDERASPVQARQATACTVNAPGTRSCWPNDSKGNAFSIDTDAETNWPQGGPTSTFTLTITKQTAVPASSAPDGTSKDMILINGSSPGPTITANWGDHLEITVINNLADNGTSMHWHGVQQKNSVQSDGVNGVTECPIPGNGGRRTYKFVANEHGTTWYHSHYSWQYGDGLYGALVINGPASADYDIDLGPMMISDYYYKSMYRANLAAAGAIVQADNIIINGKQKSAAGGSYTVTKLTAGKKHRLRLINTSVDTHFYVSLDSHTFQVIEADFVPIKNYNTTWLFLAIGQRYDVIINANQGATPGDYWFRTSIASGCGTLKSGVAAGKSIFRYNAASTADPASTASTQTLTSCVDEKLTNLRPVVSKAVPTFNYNAASQLLPISFAGKTVNNVVQWNVNGSAINIDWSKPTLEYVNNGTIATTKSLNLLTIPENSDWAYWIVSGGGAHPIHLHGHDFYVLGSGTSTGISTFSQSTIASLNFVDPARRDVAMMSGGWVALAFPTNNPGAWLMHCHIAWHVSGGLGVQFLESSSKIKTTPGIDLSQIQSQCNAWDTWYANSPFKKDDSGL